MGYEGLSIDITLSQKFMVPLVKVSYTKKAPLFANIDNIEKKLEDHYGKLYTDASLYQAEVLDWEKSAPRFGAKVANITSTKGKVYDLYKVSA